MVKRNNKINVRLSSRLSNDNNGNVTIPWLITCINVLRTWLILLPPQTGQCHMVNYLKQTTFHPVLIKQQAKL